MPPVYRRIPALRIRVNPWFSDSLHRGLAHSSTGHAPLPLLSLRSFPRPEKAPGAFTSLPNIVFCGSGQG